MAVDFLRAADLDRSTVGLDCASDTGDVCACATEEEGREDEERDGRAEMVCPYREDGEECPEDCGCELLQAYAAAFSGTYGFEPESVKCYVIGNTLFVLRSLSTDLHDEPWIHTVASRSELSWASHWDGACYMQRSILEMEL